MPYSFDQLRLAFSEQLSKMFTLEVPAYKQLLEIVQKVNQSDDIRLNRERHGAIRLGLPSELQFIKKLFAIFGMHPVNYYDLEPAGIPVHSTAFRPMTTESLDFCPFRVFTSLLKLDFITNENQRHQVQTILEKRTIIPEGITELIDKAISDKGLNESDTEQLISLSSKIFAFNPQAQVTFETYTELKAIHPLIADVVGFANPHINHLTPRTLDIDSVQNALIQANLPPKAIIEGPPQRDIPILLRQTSFKALPETVTFTCGTEAPHTARFGEIEQRGYALSKKGRALYDKLLSEVNQKVTVKPDGSNTAEYYHVLETIFQAFPDDIETLKNQELLALDDHHQPYIYEDFLPVSAAGIFTSNLGHKAQQSHTKNSYQEFCDALGEEPKTI